ncbi:hypothetical protein N7456_006682 [Penicillium angulare]|uniref:Uncharacterized protein n=1 Tax=Penicillium angulare TaxID=116970 RepID=A0A9W9FI98_9EURO|nr:hypothetical protein N7456_006682 [Penicillium angulare]
METASSHLGQRVDNKDTTCNRRRSAEEFSPLPYSKTVPGKSKLFDDNPEPHQNPDPFGIQPEQPAQKSTTAGMKNVTSRITTEICEKEYDPLAPETGPLDLEAALGANNERIEFIRHEIRKDFEKRNFQADAEPSRTFEVGDLE